MGYNLIENILFNSSSHKLLKYIELSKLIL